MIIDSGEIGLPQESRSSTLRALMKSNTCSWVYPTGRAPDNVPGLRIAQSPASPPPTSSLSCRPHTEDESNRMRYWKAALTAAVLCTACGDDPGDVDDG